MSGLASPPLLEVEALAMPFDPQRATVLFQAALDRSDPAERAAFLNRECGDDRALRDRLDQLLAGLDRPAAPVAAGADSSLDQTIEAPSGPTIAAGPPRADPGRVASLADFVSPVGSLIAGRYRIRQELGEGGMGAVYRAEQIQPVKREVAIKLIKAGMDSKTVLARFDSERQALAMMDHPHIARVLDAGSTMQGRPYFVMELVRGVPLTQYCDQHRLGLPDRLALFRQICAAVQHAHQKGVIHRDLKPTNILVEHHDGQPVPKVIDFGLAKATQGNQLSDQTVLTAFGAVAGTPLYMAPEQATFQAADIDTRTDIYALGVILYELLAGSTPIRRETIQRSALEEVLRVVREVEPPPPSQRISSSDALPSLSANRGIEPARLGRFVRGDLDWIVMKALAKERNRRYDSAIGLANDLERFLNHEPVHAGPPTARYRVGKFISRNRGAVGAASLLLLALVGGIVGTTWGLVEARRHERVATAEAAQKELARRAEADQRQQAERRLTQIQKANEILGSIFRDLDPGNAAKDGKPLAALLGERLDQATAAIQGEAIGDPLAVARMQLTLGVSQLGLGYPHKAIDLFARCRDTFTARLGPDDPETLDSANELARAYQAAGQINQAVPLFERTLESQKAKLGPDNSATLATMSNLAGAYQAAGQLDRALPLLEQALAQDRVRLGPDHPQTLSSMNNLAGGYIATGQIDRALALLAETLTAMEARYGPDHPETLRIMNNLAGVSRDAGQLDRALPLLEESLRLHKAKLGADHPETLISMNNLSQGYQTAGQLDRALPLLEQTLAARQVKLGPDHPETLNSMNNLALGYRAVGQLDRALPLFEQTLAIRQAKFGPDHPDTLSSMNNLAGTYQDVGRLDRALPLFEQILAVSKVKLGKDHPDTLNSMNNLATAYQDTNQLDRAIPLFEEAFALHKRKFGADHPVTLSMMSNVASAYIAAQQVDRALPMFEESLALHKAKLGPDHPNTLTSMSVLASGYRTAKQFNKALPLFEATLAARTAKLGPEHPDTLTSLNNMAGGYQDVGQLDKAIPLLERALATRKAKLGAEHPRTLNTMNHLADCYRQAGQHDRALAVLEELLATLRAKLGTDHPETLANLSNLASGYQSVGQPDRAIGLFRELCETRKRINGPESSPYAAALASLGTALLKQAKWTEAEPILRTSLAIREQKEADVWTTFNTRSVLGGALLGAKKFDEARPLLVAGYEGMKQRVAKIPPGGKTRLAEAVDRLIALGEATGKPDEVQTWRDEKIRLLPPQPPTAQP